MTKTQGWILALLGAITATFVRRRKAVPPAIVAQPSMEVDVVAE